MDKYLPIDSLENKDNFGRVLSEFVHCHTLQLRMLLTLSKVHLVLVVVWTVGRVTL